MMEPTGTELLLRQILETQQARAQRRLSLAGAAVLAAGVARLGRLPATGADRRTAE